MRYLTYAISTHVSLADKTNKKILLHNKGRIKRCRTCLIKKLNKGGSASEMKICSNIEYIFSRGSSRPIQVKIQKPFKRTKKISTYNAFVIFTLLCLKHGTATDKGSSRNIEFSRGVDEST